MSLSLLFSIVAAIASVVSIYLGITYIFEHAKKNWSPTRQHVVSACILIVLLVIAGLLVRGKLVVGKQDLLELREIANGAYEVNDYGTTIRLMSWAIRFEDDEESFYRERARAHKRQGDYRNEIRDRIRVFALNPSRETNHLPIIEDFILLGECDNARAWIRDHENSIKESDEKTMFGFFGLVCDILGGREYSSEEVELRKRVSQYPLTEHFAKKFWDWETLSTFVEQSSISEQQKENVRSLVQLLQGTSK
jgi:hypothetical protein